MSEKTIIRHLKRGDLKGYQETRPQDVLWVVELPEEPYNQQTSPGIDPDSDRDTRDSGEIIALRGLVEELRVRVQAQEGQIETKDRQIEQLHVLL